MNGAVEDLPPERSRREGNGIISLSPERLDDAKDSLRNDALQTALPSILSLTPAHVDGGAPIIAAILSFQRRATTLSSQRTEECVWKRVIDSVEIWTETRSLFIVSVQKVTAIT